MKVSLNRFYRRRTAQHGLVHLLLLLLAMLGLTMWGASELQLWSQDREQEVETNTQRGMEDARRALIGYAVTPPETAQFITNPPGRFNAYVAGRSHIHAASGLNVRYLPFRYFMLPCPNNDRADGISDMTHASSIQPCRDTSIINVRGSNYGRLPWRTYKTQGRYERGLGNTDFRDGRNDRLWYVASPNLLPELPATAVAPTRALAINPHALLRLTSGWLSAVDDSTHAYIADRVAAAVISPGAALGNYVTTFATYTVTNIVTVYTLGPVTVSLTITGVVSVSTDILTVTAQRIAEEVLDRTTLDLRLDIAAYLEPEAYVANPSLLAYVGPTAAYYDEPSYLRSITTRSRTPRPSDDKFVFLNIEDLVGSGSEGIKALENAPVNIYDRVEGKYGETGPVDILQAYLNAYGYLPEPALLNEENARLRLRGSGLSPAPRGTILTRPSLDFSTVTFGGTSVINTATIYLTTLTTTVNMAAAFARDLILPASLTATLTPPLRSLNLRLSDLPPVYLEGPLVITAIVNPVTTASRTFTPLPPYGAELAQMNTFNDFMALPSLRMDLLTTGGHYVNTLAGLESDAGYVISRADTSGVDNTAAPFPSLLSGISVGFDSMLAPGQTVVAVLSESAYAYFPEEELHWLVSMRQGVSELPPYALKTMLPAGTRLTLLSDDVAFRFPSTFSLPAGATYDPALGTWNLPSGGDTLVEVLAAADKWMRVPVAPDGFPVKVGDIGFFPVGHPGFLTYEYQSLPNQPIFLSAEHAAAFSYLAVDTSLVLGATNLVITPFPPPGHPAPPGGGSSPLMSPVRLPANSTFSAPAHSRIVYPRGATMQMGDTFALPEGSRLNLAPGAVVTAEVLPAAVLPGGVQLGNTSVLLHAVTLVHGGMMDLYGTVRLAGSGEGFVNKAQQFFKVEGTGPFVVTNANRQVVDTNENWELNPFVNRYRRQERGGSPLLTDAVLQSEAYVEARIVSRDRVATGRHPSVPGEVALPASYNNSVFITHVEGLTRQNGFGSSRSTDVFEGTVNVTFTLALDENTRFYLPPNTDIYFSRINATVTRRIPGTTISMQVVSRAVEFVLPPYTGFFRGGDGMQPPIGSMTIAYPAYGTVASIAFSPPDMLLASRGFALTLHDTFAATVTVGGTVHFVTMQADVNLALFPQSDMVEMGISRNIRRVIRAGEVLDVLHGQRWHADGWQRTRPIADGTFLRSRAAAQVYLPDAVTLHFAAGVDATHGVSLHYFSYADYVNSGGTSAVDNTEISFAQQPTPLPAASPYNLSLLVNINLPPRAYLHIPPGEDIHFYPDVGVSLMLSPRAIAVLPAGATALIETQEVTQDNSSGTFPFTATITYTVAGPGYIVLQPDASSALASTISISPILPRNFTSPFGFSSEVTIAPLVFLNDASYAVVSHTLATPAPQPVSRLHIPVPSEGRLDLLGYVDNRIDKKVYYDFASTDTRQLLADFPMIYTAAPECRLDGLVPPGPDCAQEEGEGLVFELHEGEEYVLQEPYALETPVLITAARNGVQLSLTALDHIGSITLTSQAVDVVQITPNGEVRAYIGGSFTAYVGTDYTNSRILLHAASASERDMQVYAGALAGTLNLVSVTGNITVVGSLSYFTSAGTLTLYGGGYVGDRFNHAQGGVFLADRTVFTLGYGARLADIRRGEALFGRESVAEVTDGANTYTLNLGEYVYAGNVTVTTFVTTFISVSTTFPVLTTLSVGTSVSVDTILSVDILVVPNVTHTINTTTTLTNVTTTLTTTTTVTSSASITRLTTVGDILLSVSLAADVRNIDLHGQYYYDARAGAGWLVNARNSGTGLGSGGGRPGIGSGSGAGTPSSPYTARTLSILAGATLSMQQGYLWQGYVPNQSDFAIAPYSVTAYVSYAQHSLSLPMTVLTASYFPNTSLHLRIHSTVHPLNLWGSGLERPESIDSDARNYAQQGASAPYGSYGNGRHTRHEYLFYDSADWYIPGASTASAPATDESVLYTAIPTVTMVSIDVTMTISTGSTTTLSVTATVTASMTVTENALTVATEGFAALIQGASGTNPTLVNSVRLRQSLDMVVAVHYNGSVVVTTAHWTPVVKHDTGAATVTIPGYVRVNSGSSSPLRTSANVLDDVATVWTPLFSSTVNQFTASYLSHEWMGRHNTVDPNLREDAMIGGFMCGGAPASVVFNMPHIDLVGTGEKHRMWPSAERMEAHPRGSIGFSPGAPVEGNGLVFDAPSSDATLTARARYRSPIGFSAAYNAPLSSITIVRSGAASVVTPEYAANITASVSVAMESDWYFYIDPSYRPSSNPVGDSPLPVPGVVFGSDFRIRGPAAIVPPFGGKSRAGTRIAYAERSYLFNTLLPGLQPLHHLYDERSASCVGSNDCPQYYNSSYWFPLVGGVLTFDGLEVAFSGTRSGSEELRMVLPQPQAEVQLADGRSTVIYAGSILYPRQNRVVAASILSPGGSYQLHANGGDIIAHVDVSPVRREINYEVRDNSAQALDGGVFNYAATRVQTQVTNALGSVTITDCFVEPLGFAEPGPYFDFDLRAVALPAANISYPLNRYRVSVPLGEGANTPLCTALGNDDARFMGCYQRQFNRHTVTAGVVVTQWLRESHSPLWFRYGGGRAGFTNNEVDFSTVTLRATTAVDVSYEPRIHTYEPLRVDGSFNRGAVVKSAGADRFRWRHSGDRLHQLNTGGTFLFVTRRGGVRVGSIVFPFGYNVLGGAAAAVNYIENTDARLPNPSAYRWMVGGVQVRQLLGVGSIEAGTSVETVGNQTEFLLQKNTGSPDNHVNLLRLPHQISIPGTAVISLGGYVTVRYPTTQADFFTFPASSTAHIVNLDLNSWLAAHPHIGLYQQSLAVELLQGTGTTQVVPAQNDSYRSLDMSDWSVLHYQRSESSQAREPFSAVPIHTNVWLRLPQGGYITGTTSAGVTVSIALGPDSLVNPIFNTYLARGAAAPGMGVGGGGAGNAGGPGSGADGAVRGVAINQYSTEAVALADIRLVRPALVLPTGTRLVAGSSGGVIRNVQAAVIFSLTPLDVVQCPTGEVDGFSGQVNTPVVINQQREGVQENRYPHARRGFGFGHPCAWLDDPENTDGDRTYIYRSRRRYADENVRLRVLSNDRTYLLGGKVTLKP